MPDGYVGVSWSDVVLAADRIAREVRLDGKPVGERWRERALEPELPSRLRILHEFLTYLEGSNVEVTANNRIELLDVVAYKGARGSLQTVEQLFRDACGLLPESLRGTYEVGRRGGLRSWDHELVIASWAEEDEVTW